MHKSYLIAWQSQLELQLFELNEMNNSLHILPKIPQVYLTQDKVWCEKELRFQLSLLYFMQSMRFQLALLKAEEEEGNRVE